MKLAAALAAFCLLFFFCSCQKEIEPTNITSHTDSTSVVDDSTLLVKWIDFTYKRPAGSDTVIFEQYTFDSRKRIIQIDLVDFDTTLGQRDYLERAEFFYNGMDTLPYKSTSIVLSQPPPTYAVTAYYKYSAGKIVADSSFYGTNTYSTVTNYTYFTSRTQINGTTYFPSGPVSTINNVYFTKVNGNTATQKDTLITYEPRYYTFSYDTNKSPFYNRVVTFGANLQPYYLRDVYTSEMVFEKNNPIDILESTSIGQLKHERYVYQYRPNGYPSSAKIYFVNNRISSTPDSVRRSYIYTKP